MALLSARWLPLATADEARWPIMQACVVYRRGTPHSCAARCLHVVGFAANEPMCRSQRRAKMSGRDGGPRRKLGFNRGGAGRADIHSYRWAAGLRIGRARERWPAESITPGMDGREGRNAHLWAQRLVVSALLLVAVDLCHTRSNLHPAFGAHRLKKECALGVRGEVAVDTQGCG